MSAVPHSTYEFDASFQQKIVALSLRDGAFNRRVEGLLKPEFFEDDADATLVDIANDHFGTYKTVPDPIVLVNVIKDKVKSKSIRKDLLPDIQAKIRATNKEDLSGRDYVIDQVSTFAQHQAMAAAILKSAEYLDEGKMEEVDKIMKKAMQVGASSSNTTYDYWEAIEKRSQRRIDLASGKIKPIGISSGVMALDKVLKHKGWGRREMTVFMGGPKSGKTTALGTFAKNASLDGYNVLYATLEVSAEILADRLDAAVTQTAMNKLDSSIKDVETKVKAAKKKAGRFVVEEFPTGTMRPSDLRRVINKHAGDGIIFDLVVVDYADIMAPEVKTNDPIENSKSVYVDLRAIAQTEDVALVTATQTNRNGANASVATMTDVAEDFNKIRIADLVISINATDEEKAMGEARLFFAASRNQEGGFTLRIKQAMERMSFIEHVIARE
jgi:replicative DNA helicase